MPHSAADSQGASRAQSLSLWGWVSGCKITKDCRVVLWRMTSPRAFLLYLPISLCPPPLSQYIIFFCFSFLFFSSENTANLTENPCGFKPLGSLPIEGNPNFFWTFFNLIFACLTMLSLYMISYLPLQTWQILCSFLKNVHFLQTHCCCCISKTSLSLFPPSRWLCHHPGSCWAWSVFSSNSKVLSGPPWQSCPRL